MFRNTQENCNTYRILKKTKLYDYIINGNLTMKDSFGMTLHFLNALPTLIEDDNQKYLIYSTANSSDKGPATYIYDLEESRTVAKISGAEVFIDYFSPPPGERDGTFLYLSNEKLLEREQWYNKVYLIE